MKVGSVPRATIVTLLVVAAVILSLDRIGAFRWADNMAVEARMALSPRQASGEIVFVGIDNRSLEAVGIWPWPRETYADIAQRLVDLGASQVFFDIDLSVPSNARSDALLAQTLAEVDGAIILPAFRQSGGLGAVADKTRDNLPLPMFRENAWLASVNVPTDADGRVRRYPYGEIIAGEEILSAASLLSGVSGPVETDFAVDLSIAPSSVPSFAAIDLLEGSIDPDAINDRSVVVGAHALELRDNVPVPVHGLVPGPMLQILAAETLIQGTALIKANDVPIFLVIVMLIIAVGSSRLRHKPFWLLGAFAAAGASIEVAAFVLQTKHALVVPTPILHVLLTVSGLIAAGSELDLRQWLLRLAHVETDNTHGVLKRIITDSSDAIVVVDQTGAILQLSTHAHALFGISESSSSSIFMDGCLPPELAAATRDAMAAFCRGETAGDGQRDLTFVLDGRTRHIAYTVTPSRLRHLEHRTRRAKDVILGCVTARDVTLAREQQARLDHLARFDVLTGAMNRPEMIERLAAALRGLATGDSLAVLAFDLERFKTVNASLGRDVGDALLCGVVDRIGALDPKLSATARLGADTFALFCPGLGRGEAEAMAGSINAMIAVPFALDDVSIRVGSRVGYACINESEDCDAASLLECAEAALDEAKLHADTCRAFDPASSDRQARARRIERALWSAIENDEFVLAYQPQIDLHSMRFAGAEALIRWQHPTMGRLPPDEFIAIAEASGFIEHLGRWVLERACTDAMAWPDHMAVAVNVSPLQFQRSDVAADVRHALSITGLDARRLHLEITETVFVAGSTELSWTLDALSDMGTSLALDDFGSGFSSFGYLAKLPLDKLKLDKMFVQALEDDPSNAAIVRSVVMLARELELKLVCEGVETKAQCDFLRSAGCDQGQGYLFGKPLEQSAILELFAASASENSTDLKGPLWNGDATRAA